MLGNAIDNLIGVVSPRWAAGRALARLQLGKIQAAAGTHREMEKLMGSRAQGGYEAGKLNRLTEKNRGSAHENDLPRKQIDNMRWRSWNLYRNNPQARKICRTLCAKVVGRGLSPQPQATKADGTPFVEFRKRARHVWDEFSKEPDFRGKPGRGGQHLTVLHKTALRAITLSGGVLFRFRHLSKQEQQDKQLFLPLQLQLIHVDRLNQEKNGDGEYYGVKLDTEGRPTGYWVTGAANKTKAIPISEMGHLFAEEDIDQLLGTPWFGAALLTMDDRRSYEAAELTAAEMAACIVGTYSRSIGQTGGIGLGNPDANKDLTDGNGNPITRLEAGMFIDTGSTGKVEIVGGNRPNISAEPFCSHLIRSEAVAMPGVKSSTLTGDYRNSSFSSERSADNDIWPELEELQDFFSTGFSQPIYEEVISKAVSTGLFNDIEDFSIEDFNTRKREYLKTNWQGPVARSINPKDDADAGGLRVKKLQSTVQLECAKGGGDWRENVDAFVEFIEYCKQRGLPDSIWQQALGIEQDDLPEGAQPTEAEQDAAAAQNRLANHFQLLNSAGSR